MFSSQKGAAYITTVTFLIGAAMPAFAQATHPLSIGVVDKDKVVVNYPHAQQAAEEIRKAEERVHKLIEDSNKQFEDAKLAHKQPAELEGLQRRLQSQIDDEAKKIQSRAQNLESQLEQEMDSAIKAEAANRKVDTVLLKQAVLIGGVDITEGVVKRLSGGAASAGGQASGGNTAAAGGNKPK